MTDMTDQEIVATFMEPKPPNGARIIGVEGRQEQADFSEHCWWMLDAKGGRYWTPIGPLTLDSLRLVEARLTEWQWWAYERMLDRIPFDEVITRSRVAIHASAEQKLRALAEVLRPAVEGVKP